MNRRTFLSSTMLSGAVGLGLSIGGEKALAFSEEPCSGKGTLACRTVAHHAEIRGRIEAFLKEKGIGEAERREIIAKSTCPFCGGPLI